LLRRSQGGRQNILRGSPCHSRRERVRVHHRAEFLPAPQGGRHQVFADGDGDLCRRDPVVLRATSWQLLEEGHVSELNPSRPRSRRVSSLLMSTLLVGIGILIGLVEASVMGWLPFEHAGRVMIVAKVVLAAARVPASVYIGMDR